MTEPTDINQYRNKVNGPDEDCVYTDDDGVKWFLYIIDYKFDNKKMSFNIWAKSLKDMEERLKAIKENGEVVGQLLSTVET